MAVHRAISRTGTGCDVLPLGVDLAGYRVIVVPALVLMSGDQADALAAAAAAGAHVVVTYFSGIADRSDRIVTGGYPGVLRELLGVRTEEFFPLGPDETAVLDNGLRCSTWAEDAVPEPGTEVLARYANGPTMGAAAITRRPVGAGATWYLSTQLDPAGLTQTMSRVLLEAGAEPAVELPAGHPAVQAGEVDVVRRSSPAGSWLFAINHANADVELPVTGFDLVARVDVEGSLRLAGGACAVVRER
jgi:beta-galactosidase